MQNQKKIDFQKVAENIFEITRKHSYLEQKFFYQRLIQEKQEACDSVGVSFEQALGQEIIRLAYKFEKEYVDDNCDYITEITQYAKNELTKWLKTK